MAHIEKVKSEYIEYEYEYMTHKSYEYEYFKNVLEYMSTSAPGPIYIYIIYIYRTYILYIYINKINNFYGTYIFRNLSPEVQQNRIIKHNREQGRTSHYQNEGQPKIYGGNAIWNVLSFLEDNYSFRCFQSDGKTLGAATEKACLSKLSFVLGIIGAFTSRA